MAGPHSGDLEFPAGTPEDIRNVCRRLLCFDPLQHDIAIDFRQSALRQLPREISLCLFRVLQEALQNGVRHSGSRHFEVSLREGDGAIELTIRDAGVGIDPEEARRRRGLGLTSVSERLKLVHGHLSIESAPGRGTLVRAQVQLKENARIVAGL